MHRKLTALLLFSALSVTHAQELTTPVASQPATAPARPAIPGISHIGFYSHDHAKSRAFYKTYLGFDEPYSLPNPDGSIHLFWVKINDHQSFEIFTEKSPTDP